MGAGETVEAIYWTKGERFVAVSASLEAGAFLDGAPKGARELRFVAEPGGGFFEAKAGVLGKERSLGLDAIVVCCHGGPGEDGTLQGALDLAGVPYTGPAASGPRCAWTSWLSARSLRPPACLLSLASWSARDPRRLNGTAPTS